MQFELRNVMDENGGPSVVGRVAIESCVSVVIQFDGYGDHDSVDGQGTPVLIENVNGVPNVVIWGDINAEEPTHRIPLDGARESLRVPHD